MRNIKLSAFADEYAAPFAEQIDGMRRFGIDYIELRGVGEKNVSALSLDEGKELKKQLDESGLRISAIGSPLGKIRLDSDMQAHLDTAKRLFELASRLDTRLVRAFSFYAPEGENIHALRDDAFAAVDALVSLAATYGITLCHENEANVYGDRPEYCRELLDAFDGKLRCVFDMGNYVLEGVDPYPEAYELLKKDIAYFHVKDSLFAGAIVPPGKGEAKIAEILAAHRAYAAEDFFVSLEPHLQTFSGLHALKSRNFDNPYKYEDLKTAFADAVKHFRELV